MALFTGNFDDVVIVSIGGTSFGGWTQAEVTRQIDAAAGSFQVELTAQPGFLPAGLSSFVSAAEPDSECTVTCNGQLVLTGRIDTRNASKDAHEHKITVSGRSHGRNAVDSSHIDPKGSAQYNNLKPSQIFKKVGDALGIKTKSNVSDESPIEWFRYNLGESSLNVMQSAALKQGLTIGHDADGSVTLSDKFEKRAPAALILGQNILKYTVKKSAAERNSDYKAKGQKLPNAKTRGKTANQMAAEAKDSGLKSYRPKYIIGLGDTDKSELKSRVQHEAARRAGLSLEVTITVVGWTVGGSIWEPGQLCHVSIPEEGIGEELLIKTVKQVKDFDPVGTITELNLTRPEAYQKGKGAGGKGKPDKRGLNFPPLPSKAA